MKKLLTIALLLVTGLFCLFAADYYITDYDVSVTVGNNAVHHIVETIDVYFDGPHHGIVREIPYDYTDYNGMLARITNLECSAPFTSGKDNGYLVMKIGSEDVTYNKEKVRFIISYDYDLGADANEGYDELYLNLVGTDWECRIDFVRFSVRYPYVVNPSFSDFNEFFYYVADNTYLTSGSYGSTDFNGEAYINESTNPYGYVLIDGYVFDLGRYEGVTIRTDLPDNWYQDARQPWDYRPLMRIVHPFLTVILAALAMLIWSKFGRDKTPIIVARFYPPKGFSPLLVGYVADSTVDDKDVISMLFYWADEGLLSIEEKKGDKYEFTKLKDIEDYAAESGKEIPSLEIRLFNGFFKNCSVGDTVTFRDLEKNNFFETIEKTKLDTKKFFSKDKALTDSKSNGMSFLVGLLALIPFATGTMRMVLFEGASGLAVVMGLVFGIVLCLCNLASIDFLFRKWHVRKSNVGAIIACIIPPALISVLLIGGENLILGSTSVVQNLVTVAGSTVLMFLSVITQKRSDYGNEVLEETLGYREFIDKAEIDQLKMMIESDPDFYYKTLGFAIVLGLENKWAEKFKGIMVSQPEWFTGLSPFDVYYLSRMSARMTRAIPMASIPRSSISGSPGSRIGGGGFGGGGFSGGGFGGGGGHAW